jgi:hypothetical protein
VVPFWSCGLSSPQERLYAKAERLAPGEYREAAARVPQEQTEFEAFAAEQVLQAAPSPTA